MCFDEGPDWGVCVRPISWFDSSGHLHVAFTQVLDRLERRISALEGERRLLRRSAHSGGKADALALEGGGSCLVFFNPSILFVMQWHACWAPCTNSMLFPPFAWVQIGCECNCTTPAFSLCVQSWRQSLFS
jgi:hypothetical protein